MQNCKIESQVWNLKIDNQQYKVNFFTVNPYSLNLTK